MRKVTSSSPPSSASFSGRHHRTGRDFGPVLALIRAKDYDDAIRLANKVASGSRQSILTKDLSAAFKYIHDIEAGLITVNLPSAGVEYQLPFGGVKDSSSGYREQGSVAINFYSELATIYMKYR